MTGSRAERITIEYEPEDGYISAMSKAGQARTVYPHKKGTVTYSYRAETYADGSLKAVVRVDSGDNIGKTILEFDRAGYLTYYEGPNYQEVSYMYE